MGNIKRLCLITNIGAHYRFPIFNLMANEILCDFYLGDHVSTPIKKFDYTELKGYRKTLSNKYFGKFYWQKGSVSLINRNYDIYIIDGEPYCLSSWVILLLAKLRGKKVIAWTHGFYGKESRKKRMLKKIFYSLHQKLMVYNEYSIQLMKESGIDAKKMYCIANSLDSDREKKIRESLSKTNIYSNHFGNNHPVVIYCGRIQRSKKLDLLLYSIAQLRKHKIIVNVIFVGKDVEETGLESIASKLNIVPQTWMYGACYEDDTLAELFYNATVCVSPGNVGLTAIHALAFGCPVITHNNFSYQMPEFESIIPNVTGDFFVQDDIEDLTEKIKKWVERSDSQRRQTREAAYQEIDRKWNIHYQIEVLKKAIYE